MEARVNYAIVGLFVIASSIVAFIGVLWLSVGLSGKHYNTYLVYLDESVSGLSVKAEVKYSGVEIGYVSEINLRAHAPDQIQLVLAIESGTPISEDTRAMLDSQGITGIAYVELTGGNDDATPLKVEPGEKYPVIKSEPSLMFRLDKALGDLSGRLDSISTGLSVLLDEDNTDAISEILKNTEKFSGMLSKNVDTLNTIITDTQTTMSNAAEISKQLPEVMASVERSAKSVERTADNLADASQEAKVVLRNSHQAIETVNNEIFPLTTSVLNDIRGTMVNIRNFSRQLDKNPSIIVRGRQPLPPGPGE